MKRILIACALLFAGLATANAQAIVPSTGQYNWAKAATGTSGQLQSYIVLDNLKLPRPGNYTIDVSVSGTTPATCTFRVEGSSDGSAWYGLDVTSPATTSCTSSFMESIANRPVLFLRINLTYTQGDNTTSVIFHYTAGRS